MRDSWELHIDVHEGTGPFALLVHGILSSRAQWLPNLDALRTVCRPVVVELWGHGRSPVPAAVEPYTPAGYVAEFERIRESLAVDSWLVIGQSLGAALTLRYGLDHPERVLAQVFTNSSSALADETWQAQMRATAPDLAQRLEAGGADAVAAMPIHPAQAKRLPADVRRALVDDAAGLSPVAVARTLLHTVPESSVRARAAHNRVPTLLVAGTREAAFEEPRAFARTTMPGVDVVELQAGHAVNISAAEEFNGAVLAFFGQHVRA